MEINKREKKKTLEKIDETKHQFSVKINTVNRYFARRIRIKVRKVKARPEMESQTLDVDLDITLMGYRLKIVELPRLEATSVSVLFGTVGDIGLEDTQYYIMTWKQQNERT